MSILCYKIILYYRLIYTDMVHLITRPPSAFSLPSKHLLLCEYKKNEFHLPAILVV